MSSLRFRRFRAHQVSLTAKRFQDSPDSHGELLPSAGETFPSLAPAAPRSSLVHRSSFDPLGLVEWFRGGLEDWSPPGKRSRVRRAVVVDLRVGRRPVRSSASRPFYAPSWREFNKLRLDPRVSTCVRRSQRREVMFALRVAGRRRSAPGRGGRYVRNLHSQWSC